ncbi:T9SS type A sorting domain-containing protein [uncultured Imperialibacter sp.]|uniref:T9SS type A sorting domain-containing protein n=1 Tax=uncultured Imperialibacter sp. TaxID=1672639 RepID=UPI0030D6D94D
MTRHFLSIVLVIMTNCLWAQETITPSPSMVFDANPGSADGGAANITSVDDRVYYEANGTLWMYDGSSSAATVNLGGATYQYIAGQLAGNIYFVASTSGTGSELFRHDGTTTSLVADINPAGDSQIAPQEYATLGGKLYFVADDGSEGSEVWKTDGTSTSRVTDIASGSGASDPQSLTVLGNTLYFTAIESANRELYSYDGLSLSLINNSDGSGYTSVPDKTSFSISDYHDKLYFTAYDVANGHDLWRYDGTHVAWFNNDKSGSDSKPRQLIVAGAKLFWLADGATASDALYEYDESAITIHESTNVSDWGQLSAYGDQLLFSYYIIPAGQHHLVTLNGGSFFTIVSSTGSFKSYVRVGKYVYYNLELDPGVSYQLGVEEIDGTFSETVDVNADGDDLIANLSLHHSTLFFEGYDGTNGKELWKLRTTNFLPEIVNAIPDTSLIILEGNVEFDLTTVFSDADQDDLTFSALTAGSGVLDASVSGDYLVLDLIEVGTATVSVTATDALGGETSFDFIVDVINPYINYSGAFEESGVNDGSVTGEIQIALTGDTFVNGGGVLTEGTHFTIDNLPNEFTPSLVVSAEGDAAILTLSGQAVDHDATNSIDGLVFTFTDAAFTSSLAANVTNAVSFDSGEGITFDVYPAATIYFHIQGITRPKGAEPVIYSLEYIFQNPGGSPTTVTATSSDEAVATTSVIDLGNPVDIRYDLKVTPLAPGTSTITVSVTTEAGATTSQAFDINVIESYLTFSPKVSLLDDLTLTDEGKRTFPYFGSPYFSPDGNKIIRQAPLKLAFQLELNVESDITYGATNSEEVPPQPLTPIATEYSFGYLTHGNSNDITFNADGTRAYISEQGGPLLQFLLSVPFDLRSESALEASITPALDGDLGNMELSADGNYLFYYAYSNKEIQQLELTAPYDISGGLTKVAAFAVDSLTSPASFGFNPDGSMVYIVDETDYTVSYYSLAAAYDLTTAPEYLGKYQFDISELKSSPTSEFYLLGVYWSKDGKKLYTETWEDGVTSLQQYAVSGGITVFNEIAGNAGEVDGEMLVTSKASKFVNAGGALEEGTHFTIENLPEGLHPVGNVGIDGYQMALTFTGAAADHDVLDNVSDLQVTFTDVAFESGTVSDFANAVAASTGFGIEFISSPKPGIAKKISDTTVYVASTPIQYMSGDYFSSGEALTYDVSSANSAVATAIQADGVLSVNVLAAGSTLITVTAIGESHGTASQTFTVTGMSPYLVFGEDDGTGTLTGGFTETEEDNGTLTGSIAISVVGGQFVNAGAALENGVHFSMSNLPEGLSPIISVNTTGDKAILTLGGQAASHDPANDVANLQITFTDAAFATGDASVFVNAVEANTGLGIGFIAIPIPEITKTFADTTAYVTAELQFDLGDYFSLGEALTYDVSSANSAVATAIQADGVLSVNVLAAGSTLITVTAIGESHGTASQTFTVTGMSPYLVFGEDDGTGTLTGGFTETEEDNGTLTGSIAISVVGGQFVNAGAALENGVHFSMSNLPEGLSPIISLNTTGDKAVLTLGGQAASHDLADDVANLQVTFTDVAFATGDASIFTNAIGVTTGFGVAFIETVAPVRDVEDIKVGPPGKGGGVITISLSEVFPDAVTLHFSIHSSNQSVATAKIVGTDIIITPVGAGVTTITVVATRTSASGRTQSQMIEFNVEVAAEVLGTGEELAVRPKIYPNPTTETFNVDFDKEYRNITVQISDVAGQLIFSSFYGSTARVECSIQAEPGTYILIIRGDHVPLSSYRIIKK